MHAIDLILRNLQGRDAADAATAFETARTQLIVLVAQVASGSLAGVAELERQLEGDGAKAA